MRKTAPPTVTRCVARQDGGYLIVLANGQSGVSSSPVVLGCRVKIDANGKVEREPA